MAPLRNEEGVKFSGFTSLYLQFDTEHYPYCIPKKQNEKITAAMALGPVRLSLRIYSNNCI